jgi:dinuclear metal center YbgI/SA1388 family protein
MHVRDIQHVIEEWAPRAVAWERDNIGIQCGDPAMAVQGILICLDVTEGVVRDALRRRANLIVSHHPLLFTPLSAVTPATHAGRTVTALVRKDIASIAAHTNLDAAPDGTSYALARVLGVQAPATLERSLRLHVKVVTFVPGADADRVARAMADAGAGIIGNYTECVFRTTGVGTFRGNASSSPSVGERGRLEHVDEVRLETPVERRRLPAVIDALRAAHPYEEAAYDVYPLDNVHAAFGMGAIGELRRPVTLAAFLRTVRKVLGTGALRYTGNPRAMVSRIAVCGGSGSGLVEQAIASAADVFLTADISFHRFQDAAGRIALIDAGHHETEYPVLPALAGRIQDACRRRGEPTPVAVTAVRTNPVAYV